MREFALSIWYCCKIFRIVFGLDSDSTKMVAVIEYTLDESTTGHNGAAVTSIDRFKVDINHLWMYYVLRRTKVDGYFQCILQIHI